MPGCNSDDENTLVSKAKSLMATYNDMSELIRLGAYRRGADAKVDEAIKYYDILEEFLRQKPTDRSDLADGYTALAKIFLN
jgi:flagellum-specific ATP synthase